MTCPHCGQPTHFVLLDDDGAHPLCGLRLIELAADVDRVGSRLTVWVEQTQVTA